MREIHEDHKHEADEGFVLNYEIDHHRGLIQLACKWCGEHKVFTVEQMGFVRCDQAADAVGCMRCIKGRAIDDYRPIGAECEA